MPYISDIQPATPAPTLDHVICGTAQFAMSRSQDSTTIITVRGELDAANGNQLVDFALRDDAPTDRLVVDLSELSFFGTAGFTALHALNVRCANDEIRYAVVTGPAVDRLLRICDPDAALPICTDTAGGLAMVRTEPPRLLQLVPKSR